MSTSSSPHVRVFVFPAAWGLPSSGPFALKLEAWLRLAGVPYDRVEEGNPAKGPKGKNPWIELDGEAIGDTTVIIRLLSARTGVDLDAWLDADQRASATALTRMVEEHLHQILEYELFVCESGWQAMQRLLREMLPAGVAGVVGTMMRRSFRKQLHARGMARHEPDEIARQGREDLDAVATVLGDKPWLFGDRPTVADCAVFGQVAPLVCAPLGTPVSDYAKSQARLSGWAQRVRETLFGEGSTASAAARA